MRKLFFLLIFVNNIAWAELPLSFISTPVISDMAVGQFQVLNFAIRNNLTRQSLPIQSISVVNDGDLQSTLTTAISNTCGAALLPQGTCWITVVLNGLQAGRVNRHLSIAYGGRTPLITPIVLNAARAKYTILIYLVASDLERISDVATQNINQMKQVGSSPFMNILLETGGALKVGFLTVQRKIIFPNSEILLQDLGQINMGLPSTIQDFLIWGITNYPAERYIAIFWNHGGGINGGFGSNQIFGGTATPINQLSVAVKTATQLTGRNFEIIGFDACLLGNFETISGLYPYTNYVVGSEDLEPGAGWQYNTFLNFVKNFPNANGVDIGKVIADGYTAQNQGDSTTLSVVSSVDIPNLLFAINQFTTTLSPYVNSSISNWKLVARGRNRAPDYSTSAWDNESTDLVDLVGLARGMATVFPSDPHLQNAANALITYALQAVKYVRNSPNRGSSFGITVYFPSILAQYIATYPLATLINGVSFFSPAYTNLITNYHNFYTAQSANLIATPSSLGFNGTDYTAIVSNDFEELFAAVGSDTCNNVFNNNGTPLGIVPCYSSVQSSGIQITPGGGGTFDISFNKATHLTSWPLINGHPALLIGLDTEPVIPNEISFIIPVTKVDTDKNGFLSIVKDSSGNYRIEGFQADSGRANPDGKTFAITNGTVFRLRTFAENAGVWALFRTNVEVTAPLTLTFGAVPAELNRFRFIVSDLTGALQITNTSVPY